MPKPAWYVITEPTTTARELSKLLLSDASPDAVRIALLLETMAIAADQVAKTLPHATNVLADRHRLAAILHTYNQVIAAAAQTTGRLAHHLHPGPDFIDVPDIDHHSAGRALATAASRLIEAAGLFKEAHHDVSSHAPGQDR